MPIQRDKDLFDSLPSNWWARDFSTPQAPEGAAPQISNTQVKPWLWRFIHRLLRILIWPFALFLNSLLTAAIGTLAFYLWLIPTLPGDAVLTNTGPQQPLLIYDNEQHLMGEFGAERRDPVRYADTPPLLVKAFLAAEDNRFFEHSGVDIYGIGRAVLNLIQTGEPSQGGSTITMQLVRNLFLTPEKSMLRKLSELALAMHLETRFSKEQIFELYENRIFFGHHAYGVAAAAKIYYNKSIDKLSLAQMATLAGIPQAPSVHNPVTYPQRAVTRRAYVLGRMLALSWITKAQYDQASTAPEDAHLTTSTIDLDAPYLTEMARQEAKTRYGDNVYTSGLRIITTTDTRLQHIAQRAVISALVDYDHRHGYRGAELHVDPAASQASLDELLANHPALQGLNAAIVLKLDANTAHLYLGAGKEGDLASTGAAWAIAQQRGKASRRLTALLKPGDLIRISQDSIGKLSLAQIPVVEGALVAMSPKDGAIKALVGGFDFSTSQFNRAADARRQPGSSFKPFVYATALSQGWTPDSIIEDSPLQIRNGRHIWRPKDFDGRFLGKITLRLALADSRNLAAVQLLRHVGVKEVRAFATRFGFRSEQLPHGLSLALGSGESAPLQMAGAYATFANGGFRVAPYLIAQVQDTNGHTLLQAAPSLACPDCATMISGTASPITVSKSKITVAQRVEPVLKPQVAAAMLDLLKEVIRSGTGKRALALNRTDIAGKTGTSNDVRDAWFCGFNPDLVAVAWLGFDDFSPLGRDEVGGHSALGMWIDFMGEALAKHPDEPNRQSSPQPKALTVDTNKILAPVAPAPTAAGDQDTVEDTATDDDASPTVQNSKTPTLPGKLPTQILAPQNDDGP